MRKYLLAAAAAAAIAAPATQASARDHSGYFGLEGGILKAKSQSVNFDATDSFNAGSYNGYYMNYYLGTYTPRFRSKNSLGYDIDAVAGYDFGMFRLEAEVGYKRANHNHYTGPNCLAANAGACDGSTPVNSSLNATATLRRFPGWSTVSSISATTMV